MKFDEEQVEIYRLRTKRSEELWKRTKDLIPTGHGGGMGAFHPHPIVLERGKGCWLWDVDGNRYLDLRLGDWVLVHGHSDDDIRDAVYEQMGKMVQVGAPEWDLGHRMAELLVERVPSVEKVRFFVSGTDANTCALKLARAFTGRKKLPSLSGATTGSPMNSLWGSRFCGTPTIPFP